MVVSLERVLWPLEVPTLGSVKDDNVCEVGMK